MKKALAIFLISTYLCSALQIQELAAIPKFIEHFKKHQLENPEMGLISFIQLHYFSGDVKDADYKEDMKLPFKAIDTFQAINITFLPSQFEWENQVLKLQFFKTNPIFQQQLSEQNYFKALLRPPITV